MNRLDQITKSVSDSTGLSQSQVARIAFGASGHLGFNTAIGGAQTSASGDKAYLSGLSADQRKVLASLSSEQVAEFKQFGDRVSRDSSFSDAVSSDSREARELASRLSTTTSRSQRAEASFTERNALAERLSSAREQGETISIDIAQDPHNLEMFMRYAERYGGSSAAAFAMFDAELARQGLRPNRAFSDGAALPMSFDELHRRHELERNDPLLNPDQPANARANSRRVSGFGQSVLKTEEAAQPSAVRSEVQIKAQEIRQQAESTQGSFDGKAEIVRTPDGTLATKRSLLVQSGKQVAGDASASIESAKDAVKGLLKRK